MKRQSIGVIGLIVLITMMFAGCYWECFAFAGPPWDEVDLLIASGKTGSSKFGSSIAISGDFAIVGAPGDIENGPDSGAAYVFNYLTGQEIFKLHPSDGAENDQFGFSVALNGHIALIGASFGDGQVTDSGAAYVFDVTTGEELFKIVASDGKQFDRFGSSVALNSDFIVIGAPYGDNISSDTGAVYLYDAVTGQPQSKLVLSDGVSNDAFGISVSIDDNHLAIGSPGDTSLGSHSGAAYIYDVVTGEQLHLLLASDGGDFDSFGDSISISGNRVLIGANRDNDNDVDSGSAYLFDVTTGEQLFKFLASDGLRFDSFGTSVSIDGNTAMVGAPNHQNEITGTGSVYIFDATTGKENFIIRPHDVYGDQLGSSIAISGDYTLLGSPFIKVGGATYIYQKRSVNLLALTPDPLIAGERGVFSIVRALPNKQTWLLYSIDGLGTTFLRQLNVIIDLSDPNIAFGPRRTDSNGNLELNLPIPDSLHPIDVWFQVVQSENVTNFAPTQIIP